MRHECEAQIRRYKGCIYKKFETELEARGFVSSGPESRDIDSVPKFATAPASTAASSRQHSPSTVMSEETAFSVSSSYFEPEERGWEVAYTHGASKGKQGDGRGGPRAGVGVWWAPGHEL
jgi:hypothetical protein